MATFKHLLRLATDAEYRKTSKQLVISGHHVVSEYIRNGGQVIDLFTSERYKKSVYSKSRTIAEDKLTRITREAKPEGILATIPYPSLINSSIISEARRSLLLFQLSDPRNVGSLARTALALGWDQLVLVDCCDPFGIESIRCSKGALLYNPRIVIRKAINTSCIPGNTTVYYATVDGTNEHGKPAENLMLVLGSESHGLSRFPKEMIDSGKQITIRTSSMMQSLSVSAAGAILMSALNASKISC